jgi:hypothetical protein
MVRTKYLEVSQGLDNFEEIDELINDFIKCHPEIEIIDIKFQSNVSAVADNYVSAEYYHTSALIIYKENQR